MIYKRLLAFFLSFALIFSSTSALANNASVGGWTALDSLIVGSNTTINAVKGAGSTALKSAITVAPVATNVGKYLLKGASSVAIAYALVGLADGALDWVLDPANNTVTYKYTPPITYPGWKFRVHSTLPYVSTPEKACKDYMVAYPSPGQTYSRHNFVVGSVSKLYSCYLIASNGGEYNFNANAVIDNAYVPGEEYKSIPIANVATQVIANAEAGHLESKEALKSAAIESFVAGEYDVGLESAAIPYPVADQTLASSEKSLAAANTSNSLLDSIKSVLSNILSSITSLADWFKGEPESNSPSDNNIDIPEVPLPDIDSSVSFGGSCPSDLGVDFNLYGTNFNFVLMPFSTLCPLLSTFIKPTLILLGSFMAVSIVGGRKDA